jgi:C1A family cysteine protease
MSQEEKPITLGYERTLPDIRDFTPETPEIKQITDKLAAPKITERPSRYDSLIEFFPPVLKQKMSDCVAYATVAKVEFFEIKNFGKRINHSQRFIYKMTKHLQGRKGSVGTSVRQAFKSLQQYGVCHEETWPYSSSVSKSDVMPSDEAFKEALNYQAIKYFRVDKNGVSTKNAAEVLNGVKDQLLQGLPTTTGFTTYASIKDDYTDDTGNIPFPSKGEKVRGGHMIVVYGYDDNLIVKNNRDNTETKGALLIRNSWGTGWGDDGYGALPYKYIEKAQTDDFWVLVASEWPV